MKLYEILEGKQLPTLVQDRDGKVWKIVASDSSGFNALQQNSSDTESAMKSLSYQALDYELI
jgi:hypothetical protein